MNRLYKTPRWIAAAMASAFLGLTATTAFAEVGPALLYDLGGKFDRSFNENAYYGAVEFQDETGIVFRDFEPTNEAQREQALRRFANSGGDPIVTIGFSWAAIIEKVAPDFPNTKFVVVDTVVDLPNVQSVEFRYNEGAYLVGALAGLTTETDTVGFVGGMDIPIIRDFSCAYRHGAQSVNAEVTVLENMTGTTPSAWADPARGRELALGQYDRGADIVFAAAGGTTMGILQASADAGKLSIGVGVNQNGIQPGHVLTSATAEVGRAVYLAFKAAEDGTWQPGLNSLGLAEDGVGWVIDENNRGLISAEVETEVNGIRDAILAGDIKVPSYFENDSCPK